MNFAMTSAGTNGRSFRRSASLSFEFEEDCCCCSDENISVVVKDDYVVFARDDGGCGDDDDDKNASPIPIDPNPATITAVTKTNNTPVEGSCR
jgi:hypothetical protein